MLLAGSTRYLSSFTKQRMASLFRAVPPTLPYLHNTVASSVLFHTELTPDKFPAYGCMHHNLRGNPIPRTDKRNPLRLNTGQEYTSQHKARKPLSLLASMYEFGCAGPSQALPAPLRSNRAPSVERRFRFSVPGSGSRPLTRLTPLSSQFDNYTSYILFLTPRTEPSIRKCVHVPDHIVNRY